jgi:hypothetical protein
VAATHLKGHLRGPVDIRLSLSSRAVAIHPSSQVASRLSSRVDIRPSRQAASHHSNPVIRSRVDIRPNRRPDIRLSSNQGPLALKGLGVSLQVVPLHRARRVR